MENLKYESEELNESRCKICGYVPILIKRNTPFVITMVCTCKFISINKVSEKKINKK